MLAVDAPNFLPVCHCSSQHAQTELLKNQSRLGWVNQFLHHQNCSSSFFLPSPHVSSSTICTHLLQRECLILAATLPQHFYQFGSLILDSIIWHEIDSTTCLMKKMEVAFSNDNFRHWSLSKMHLYKPKNPFSCSDHSKTKFTSNWMLLLTKDLDSQP